MEKDLRQSGRTTRMIEYAVQRMRDDQRSCVIAHSQEHANYLRAYALKLRADQYDEGWPDDRQQHVLFTNFDYVTVEHHNIRNPRCGWSMFDYRTNEVKIRTDKNVEYLIDHFALEKKLQHIITYLKTAKLIQNHDQWLIDTARLLSLDRRVYLIAQEDSYQLFKEQLDGHNVSVEDGTMMGNIDWLQLRIKGNANFYSQILFRPSYLQEQFAGSLNEIHRWDNK